jgi:hypothetical protein
MTEQDKPEPKISHATTRRRDERLLNWKKQLSTKSTKYTNKISKKSNIMMKPVW